MLRIKASIVVIMLLLQGVAIASGVYQWTDENGGVHFSDRKPETLESQEVDLKINTYENVSYDASIFDTGKNVVIYTTSWCTYCKKAKDYFKREGIRYTEYDIEKNDAAKRRYQKMGAQGVPVILVGTRRMNGFSEQGFQRLYN